MNFMHLYNIEIICMQVEQLKKWIMQKSKEIEYKCKRPDVKRVLISAKNHLPLHFNISQFLP